MNASNIEFMSTKDTDPKPDDEFDKRVGRNIVHFRDGMSQQDLAIKMRQRGFRWSQATIWSVEKGERPVRLSEVAALSEILDKPTDSFFLEEHAMNQVDSIAMALEKLLDAQQWLEYSLKIWLQARNPSYNPGLSNTGIRIDDFPKHTRDELIDNLQLLQYLTHEVNLTDLCKKIEQAIEDEAKGSLESPTQPIQETPTAE